MEKDKCLIYIFDSFSNSTEVGGIIAAREKLTSLKGTNKPFLEKHPEYKEDYEFHIEEFVTNLEYFIYNKEIYGSKKDRGDIQGTRD